jgi:hypothetical protein
LGTTQAVGTILNDDAAPLPLISLAVAPASVTEDGATNLIYTFTRTGDTASSLLVNYSIAGTATNGLTLRIGTFNSASDADIQALGYNLLWVNNQFTIMTPSAGGIVTSSINSTTGSFASDGTLDAFWTTGALCAHAGAPVHFAGTPELVAALQNNTPPRPAARSVLVKGSRFMKMEQVVQALRAATAAPEGSPCC